MSAAVQSGAAPPPPGALLADAASLVEFVRRIGISWRTGCQGVPYGGYFVIRAAGLASGASNDMDRTIRLFVSSTFADMKAERDVLQRVVFPRLRQLCLAQGLRFQPIDLRWGVSDEAGNDNRTMRLCLRELARCQRAELKPNFLILLGDRYGWRPLPEVIPAALWARLAGYLRQHTPAAAGLLKRCYRRDDNAWPTPEYVLQPRSDAEDWGSQVEQPLLAALEEAVAALGDLPGLAELAIGHSATHQEITHGALKVEDARQHVHAFFRSIKGLSENAWPVDYVDVVDGGVPDRMAQARLKELRAKILAQIGESNVQPLRGALARRGAGGGPRGVQ